MVRPPSTILSCISLTNLGLARDNTCVASCLFKPCRLLANARAPALTPLADNLPSKLVTPATSKTFAPANIKSVSYIGDNS